MITRQSPISTMYETVILLTLVNRHWSKHLVDFHVTFRFILRIFRLVRPHVNERARNKNIQHEIEAMNISIKSRNLLMQKMSTFARFIYFQIFNLINDDLHRMFSEKSKSMSLQQHQVRSFSSRSSDKCNLKSNDRLIQFRITSCLNANDFICFQNDRIRDLQNLHMLAEIFRANSRFRCTFLDSRKFLTQLQSANAVKDISPSICLAIDSHRSSRESGRFLFENIDLKESKVVCFSDLSRVTLLSWESH